MTQEYPPPNKTSKGGGGLRGHKGIEREIRVAALTISATLLLIAIIAAILVHDAL